MLILLGMIFFFFFLRDFQLMVSVPDKTFYYQTKIPIEFWCRWRLKPRSITQP